MIKEIYPSLQEINDKEVLRWVLTAFLKDSLDYLASDPKAKKTKRIDWIHSWIEKNMPDFLGEYQEKDNIVAFNKIYQNKGEKWKKLES